MYKDLLTVVEESTGVVTHEGGKAYQVGALDTLRRFLIVGATGTFYVDRKAHVDEFRALVEECLNTDYDAALAIVREVSDKGLAISNEPALYTLAIASTYKGKNWQPTFHTVVRTGTHLLHFLAYTKGKRGWGRSLRRAVADWFRLRDANTLAYQAVKYKSRDGWSLADALRKAHPMAVTPEHGAVMKWIVDGEYPEGPEIPALVIAADMVKRIPENEIGLPEAKIDAVASIIRETRLPREAVPTELLNERAIWDALLDDMPITALIRNLPKMTEIGLLDRSGDGTKRVILALTDEEKLRKGRVHPIQVLLAMKVYASGHGDKSSKVWSPVPIVVDALDAAFYATFGNVPTVGKPLVLGVDASGSMTGTYRQTGIVSPAEAAAAMALITTSVEPDCRVLFFDDRVYEHTISKRQRLDDVVATIGKYGRATYTNLVPKWAASQPEPVDGLVIYTDSETWDTDTYPALRSLRGKHGRVRAACVAIEANNLSLFPEEDRDCLNVAGFGPDVPHVLHAFLTGAI